MTCLIPLGVVCGILYVLVITAASRESTSTCIAVHSHLGFCMLLPTNFQKVLICSSSRGRVIVIAPPLAEITRPLAG